MKVLAFDIAKRTGWAFRDEIGFHTGVTTFENLKQLHSEFMKLIDLWRPDLCCFTSPFLVTIDGFFSIMEYTMECLS